MSSTVPSPYDADAADAAKYLDQASGDAGDSARQMAHRAIAALQGIGFAVLATGDRLGDLLDAADDANRQLGEIADAVAILAPEPRTGTWRRLYWRLRGRRLAGQAEAGTWLPVGAGDVPVLAQALADAARMRQVPVYGDCIDCVRARTAALAAGTPDASADLERCDVHARESQLAAAYAALRFRIGGAS